MHMQLPLQISFHHMDPSAAVEARIRDHVRKLYRLYDRITSCRVVIEAPHRHHNKGNLYRLKVEVNVPDDQLVASRDRDRHQAHEDLYVAVRDAFDAVRHQLDGYVRRRRGDVKTHG